MRIFIVIGLPIQQKMRILRVRISVKCNDGMHRQIELMHMNELPGRTANKVLLYLSKHCEL